MNYKLWIHSNKTIVLQFLLVPIGGRWIKFFGEYHGFLNAY